LPDDLNGQFLEITEHWHWELDDLDLALELDLESLQCDRVLHMVIRQAINLYDLSCVREGLSEIDRKRLVRLFVEAESGHGSGLVPAGIIVVARGVVQAALDFVVRPGPVRAVEHAALEGGVDDGSRSEDDRAARLGFHLAAETWDTQSEASEVP